MRKKNAYDGKMSDRIDMKVFILFLLDEMHYPLTESVIAEIVDESGNVGRFDFKECFSELVERGHVIKHGEGETAEYTVSEAGHNVASELQGSLHDKMREDTRIAALRRLSLHKRGAVPKCTVTPTEDGRYTVRCEITEKGSPLLDTSVTVLSATEAEAIRKHFAESPEEVMRGILSVLTGRLAYYMS